MDSTLHLLPSGVSVYDVTLIENIFYSFIGIVCGIASGWLLYRLCRAFMAVRPRFGAPLLIISMGISSVMVIWVGDPNLLYTFPFYFAGFMLATRGNRIGRLSLSFIFFCLTMSVAAILDTYIGYGFIDRNVDLFTRIGRFVIIALVYLCFRRFLPQEPPHLSRNLWLLVLALSLMPLSALFSTVLLTYPRYYSQSALDMSLRLGLGILPFVFATSLVLLAAVLVLARQQALEEAGHLASLRETYYENLRSQDQQLRHLRHDMRNHMTTLQGLLELGKVDDAQRYVQQITETSALRPQRRYSDNEVVNIVLAAKEQALSEAGIASDFEVKLPAELPFADADLCALLGNALDNAREGATGCAGATVRLRCRFEKGLLMLSVENPVRGPIDKHLHTTKADKDAHGYGLPSMKSIAARYGGSLETSSDGDHFRLLVCLST